MPCDNKPQSCIVAVFALAIAVLCGLGFYFPVFSVKTKDESFTFYITKTCNSSIVANNNNNNNVSNDDDCRSYPYLVCPGDKETNLWNIISAGIVLLFSLIALATSCCPRTRIHTLLFVVCLGASVASVELTNTARSFPACNCITCSDGPVINAINAAGGTTLNHGFWVLLAAAITSLVGTCATLSSAKGAWTERYVSEGTTVNVNVYHEQNYSTQEPQSLSDSLDQAKKQQISRANTYFSATVT